MLARGEAAGVEPLQKALTAFVALGATGDARITRRSFRRHSLPVPRRGRSTRSGDRLTRREEQVVELAARGRLAREIADALSISRRTAEHHLERAMTKLGVQRKRDLVDRQPILNSGEG
jgi:DNA-binding NarL/FixJ family response regulator